MNNIQKDLSYAEGLANSCKDLQGLELTIRSFDRCLLKNTANNIVFSDGNPNADLMLIGEAPGFEEDQSGIPFVGIAGQLLDKMLLAIGQNRNNTYITNMVFWRPPGNRKPTEEEISLCYPFVKKHIELINPKILILSGAVAAQSILKSNLGITRLRGNWSKISFLKNGEYTYIMPIFHPAYLLRSPEKKKETWEDLKSIKKKLTSTDI